MWKLIDYSSYADAFIYHGYLFHMVELLWLYNDKSLSNTPVQRMPTISWTTPIQIINYSKNNGPKTPSYWSFRRRKKSTNSFFILPCRTWGERTSMTGAVYFMQRERASKTLLRTLLNSDTSYFISVTQSTEH